jgi:hypothetical protein
MGLVVCLTKAAYVYFLAFSIHVSHHMYTFLTFVDMDAEW